MRVAEAGFTLIEILIAAALFVAAAFGAFELVRQSAANANRLRVRALAYAAVERLTAQLRAESRSAVAIWSSAPAAGAGHDDCVQLDFAAVDGGGPKFWSYRTFPNHGAGDEPGPDALVRLAGTAPIAPCDPSQRGETVLAGLRSAPAIALVPPAGLSAHQDPYAHANDSPFVAAGVPPTPPIALDVRDAGGAPLTGGNRIAEVRIDTADASRVVDLLPGVVPNGFTATLRYTCSERCDVGHDTAAPKTLTACAMSWQTLWSEFVPGGWFIAGTFTFTYSGVRASDGGVDTLARVQLATNDGSGGTLAPWDVKNEAPAAWFADFAPYAAAAESAPLAAEKQRCDAVQRAGAAGAFYLNG
ncbi:hypothetical protein WPS_24500 [Vulcanimicrobium alpinum]|uniref:Prepilin-type N-terminal cleavage/methylation domain-containing protein n=1 Tax=Vulcanimicrobium alpinum TaxID=3016050 RepID=A0AAN1XXH6_UNVUL|nr:hypothetical protein [Vulcanimicrobium alpinum]BDE07174.1 hypothetical protein WPS_24500 [Vulcanimicrobium alpinum]